MKVLVAGRNNSCSVLEAITLTEKLSKIKFNYKILKKNRTGDHKWYITNNSKFRKHYKKWKMKYNLKLILKEMISKEIENNDH